jgi:OFA family oxalate/formate antiporter-like MFS transporter
MTQTFNRSLLGRRWIYVPIGATIHLILGSIYAFSVFRKPLETLWNISVTESGLPYLVFLAAFGYMMPFGGMILEKIGPKKTSILGSVLVGTGWVLASFSQNVYVLTLLYGVLGGIGVGITYGVPIAVSTKWFPDKKGLAIGLTVLGFGLSALIMAPLMTYLIINIGPLSTFGYLGTAFLITLVILSLPLKFPPEDFKFENKSSVQTGKVSNDYTPSQMLKTKSFYALWIAYTIGTTAGLMAIGISAPFGREVAKVDPVTSGLAVSIFAVFNGLGRPLFGWLTDRITPRKAALLSYTMIVLVSLALAFFGEGNVILYLIGFSVLWLNLGGWLAIAPTATASFFGTKFYGKNYGIVFTAYGTGAIIGTLTSGVLRDITGSYLSSFYVVALLAIFGIAIVILLLKKPSAQ